MNWVDRLASPLNYLRIEHKSKRKYDLYIPLFVAILIGVLISESPLKINIFGSRGLIEGVDSLLQTLVGFYIASLAAIATFNKASLDFEMPGDPPKLRVTQHGHSAKEPLTRRRFLCFMFGYLAFLCIFV